jgi:hypothetical protein
MTPRSRRREGPRTSGRQLTKRAPPRAASQNAHWEFEGEPDDDDQSQGASDDLADDPFTRKELGAAALQLLWEGGSRPADAADDRWLHALRAATPATIAHQA